MSFMFNHRIKNREQLAHASDQRDLEKFAVSSQPFIEVSDHAVASGSDQRSHVQRTTHWSSAAPNRAPTFEGTAVAGERSQAGQSRDLFAIESSELGQLSDQLAASDRANAGILRSDSGFSFQMGLCWMLRSKSWSARSSSCSNQRI